MNFLHNIFCMNLIMLSQQPAFFLPQSRLSRNFIQKSFKNMSKLVARIDYIRDFWILFYYYLFIFLNAVFYFPLCSRTTGCPNDIANQDSLERISQTGMISKEVDKEVSTTLFSAVFSSVKFWALQVQA